MAATEGEAVKHLRQALVTAKSPSLKSRIEAVLRFATSSRTGTPIWFPDGLRTDYPDFQLITGASEIVQDDSEAITNDEDLIVAVHNSTRLDLNTSSKIKSMPLSKRVFFVLAQLEPKPKFFDYTIMGEALAKKGWNGKNFSVQNVSYRWGQVTGTYPSRDTAVLIKEFFSGETVGSARIPGREEIIHALLRAKGDPQEAVKVIQSYQ